MVLRLTWAPLRFVRACAARRGAGGPCRTFALTLADRVPLTLALRGMLAAQFGAQPDVAEAAHGRRTRMVAGVHVAGDRARARRSCRRSSGSAPCCDNLSDLLDNVPLADDHCRRRRRHGWSSGRSSRAASSTGSRAIGRRGRVGFFGACGAHFPALARLGLLALIVYGVLFRWLHPLLLDDAYARLTRDLAVERRPSSCGWRCTWCSALRHGRA